MHMLAGLQLIGIIYHMLLYGTTFSILFGKTLILSDSPSITLFWCFICIAL